MNLLLILNEYNYGAHVDVHNACKRLLEDNILESYKIYPFREKINAGIKLTHIRDEIIEEINKYKPELILFSHTGGLKVDFKYLFEAINVKFQPAIGYWDGDIYHTIVKPLPGEIKNIVSHTDVCFWCGFDNVTRRLSKRGRKDFRYVPLSTDERFIDKKSNVKLEYDVVMVGNYVSGRIPFKTFPGSRMRKKVANFLYKKLGDRFAVYGNGWQDAYAKGPIPFEKQYEAYQKSRITLGVNNLHADYYFSNRLPIALSCGKIMIHNYENGVERIFNEIGYDYFFKDVTSLWEKIQFLLNKTDSEIEKEVKKYQKFASEKIDMYSNIKYMVDVLIDYYISKNSKNELKKRQNPWTKFYEPHKY